uniref:Mitogen-activated protein kinase kinase kinase n=1 Tax=Panagrolaimus sp. JU765 TaxID=591449 RepID=A0AC34Q658_9BILA
MSSSSDSGNDKLVSYPRIPRENLEVQEQLGCGSFGSVYRGIWKNVGKELVVAMKKVFMLEKEVDILSQIRHRNIIHFFGVSSANPDFYIVTEFAENGSLYEYLHNDSAELPFDLILQWAQQIANGVAYLHFEAPATIIHRDLKSKNIVLSKNHACKLCDFGTSKDLTHSFTMPTWAGTAAWMSPEIISQKEGITPATDVWSYGVVLWELVSREVPYKGLTEFKIYSIITQHGERLVIPETCPVELKKLLKDCWHTNPKDRIDMKTVILQLQNMESNRELHLKCSRFVNQKEDWRHEIETQLTALNALKIDLARQKEELERREQALTRRETTHRSFLHLQGLISMNNINLWTQKDVSSWLIVVTDNAPGASPEIVDKLTAFITQYKIDGPRLLNVDLKDLLKLGIEKGPFCEHLLASIHELKSKHLFDVVEFPTLRMSSIIERRNKADKSKQPFDFPVVIHVGLYQREACSTTCSSRYRFKIFVDTDWQACTMVDSMPAEIYDSATVVKDVCISLVDNERRVILDTVRCLCPPFGYLEWVNAPQDGSSVHLTCAITYTDQVIKPRNTCIKVEITDFTRPQTIQNKVVMLRIRPIATNTSLSRISSALFNNNLQPSGSSVNSLQGAWRRRRSSFGQETAPTERPHLPSKTWSNIASTNTPHDLQHSVSLNVDSVNEFPHLTSASSTNNHTKTNFSRLKQTRRNSERSNEEHETRHPSFFLDSASPSVSDANPLLHDIVEKIEIEEKKESKKENEQCCKNNCRHRNHIRPPKEISNIDEASPRKNEKKKNRSQKKPKKPRQNPDSINGFDKDADIKDEEIQENVFSRSSQNIYGGYGKWKWR